MLVRAQSQRTVELCALMYIAIYRAAPLLCTAAYTTRTQVGRSLYYDREDKKKRMGIQRYNCIHQAGIYLVNLIRICDESVNGFQIKRTRATLNERHLIRAHNS